MSGIDSVRKLLSISKNLKINVLHILAAAIVMTAISAAQVFNPVPWPSNSSWRPYTYDGITVNDKKIQDPSNGGTSPQSYVNISSGNPDQTYPSTYFYYDGSTIFLRFRVESSPLVYSGGASIQNADPYAPSSWVLLLDVNGDGWRDFALFLDGGSGGPGNPIDDIKVIYSNITGNQSIDPATAGVYLLSTIKTAQPYTSGPNSGKLKQFDGNGFEVSGTPWPL
jgi:hypothetical protein